jgi:hypothetical protein
MVDRLRIKAGGPGNCTLCSHYQIDTASEYEWDCPILKGTICETHCCEVQLRNDPYTRIQISEMINWQSDPMNMIDICVQCPFGDLAQKSM